MVKRTYVAVSLIAILSILTLMTINQNPVVFADHELTFDVEYIYEDGSVLSVLNNEKEVNTVIVSILLKLDTFRPIESVEMNGLIFTRYNGETKQTVTMNTQKTALDSVYRLGATSISSELIDTWDYSNLQLNTLSFETSEISMLTITFVGGSVQEKTFPKAYAELTITSSQSNNIEVADLVVETSHSVSENLADIPDDWSTTYGSGPQIIHIVTDMTRTGNPSFRLDPHVDGVDVNNEREIDGTWYEAKPGDVIQASVYIYCEDSTEGKNFVDYYGGRLGMDMYAHTSAGYGVVDSYPHDGEQHRESVVPWGTKQWVQKTITITIPNTYYTRVVQHYPNWMDCDPVQIDHFVLWLDARSYTDGGRVFFTDAELYINP